MAKEEVEAPQFAEDDGSGFVVEAPEAEAPAAEGKPAPEAKEANAIEPAKEAAGDEVVTKEAEQETKTESKEIPFKDLPEGVRRRIARANRQRDEANAKLAEAVGKAKAPDGEEADDEGEPDPDDFDSFDEYLKARDGKPDKKQDKQDKQDAQKNIDGVLLADFQPVLADLKEKVETSDPDIWEKAANSKDLTISAPLVMALNEADNPAAIIEHLTAHPDEAKDLSGMSQFGQAKAIAKLEAKVKSPAKKATNAPPPPETTQARGISPEKSYSDMSQREFEKARNEQERGQNSLWL